MSPQQVPKLSRENMRPECGRCSHLFDHITDISLVAAAQVVRVGLRSNIAYVLPAIGITCILVVPMFSRSSRMA
jgi:hypothetical protein